ncbi:alpha/beta hydrolase [Massilia sp. W12]|uniref:alpha/beta fold hydrolase n=1 Tax=Massilia sp. W12 TaxID=3126507 RepID=UPI0030D46F36
MQASRSEFLQIRGLRYHIRQWGDPQAPRLFLLHGWMDVSASFQFMIDALQQEWHCIAPDWRGFGLTENSASDTYWFADYLADLDAIFDHYQPAEAVRLVGHSMGGNVAMLYAGVKPERVAALANLEGFGLPATDPAQAPRRMRHWLDEIKLDLSMRPYDDLQQVQKRLQKNNPRLSDARAAFLAQHWARQGRDGKWQILGDVAHKRNGPLLYQVEQIMAAWRQISAPVLWIEGAQTDVSKWFGPEPAFRTEIERRIGHLQQVQRHVLPDAGHMLHHDQPELLAQLLEDFMPR